jgi:RecB family endonuclease NucS
LASTPEMLEEGASCLGVETDVEFGVADLIFRGGDERPVVLEIKIHADDSAVGQVSRIAKGYADKEAVDPQSVRKAIVCLSYVSTLVEACKGANIELYKVSLNRV